MLFFLTFVVLTLVLGAIMARSLGSFSIAISFVPWSGLKTIEFLDETRLILGWWVVSIFRPGVQGVVDNLHMKVLDAFDEGYKSGFFFGSTEATKRAKPPLILHGNPDFDEDVLADP